MERESCLSLLHTAVSIDVSPPMSFELSLFLLFSSLFPLLSHSCPYLSRFLGSSIILALSNALAFFSSPSHLLSFFYNRFLPSFPPYRGSREISLFSSSALSLPPLPQGFRLSEKARIGNGGPTEREQNAKLHMRLRSLVTPHTLSSLCAHTIPSAYGFDVV